MQQQQKAPGTAQSNPGSSPHQQASGRAAIQMMQGKGLADQLAMLAPRENAKAPEASPVQLRIDSGTLTSKLESDANYNGTIDSDTDCATANSVGDEWVGGGATRQKYGPPFGYQLLSADGKRQYRPPMVKQQSKAAGQAQANYEARAGAGKHFTFNAHVSVTDIAAHQPPAQGN